MDRPLVMAALRQFAEERLNARAYPDCIHEFRLCECDRCEADLFAVRIERHPGDRPGDFQGRVHLRCRRCGAEKVALGVTAFDQPDPPEARLEETACPCGGQGFRVALCERMEDWGFFDEGTMVARCQDCGRLQPLVDTD